MYICHISAVNFNGQRKNIDRQKKKKQKKNNQVNKTCYCRVMKSKVFQQPALAAAHNKMFW